VAARSTAVANGCRASTYLSILCLSDVLKEYPRTPKNRLVTSPASAEPSSITVETTGLAFESRLKSKTEQSQYSSMHLLLQLPQVRSQ